MDNNGNVRTKITYWMRLICTFEMLKMYIAAFILLSKQIHI